MAWVKVPDEVVEYLGKPVRWQKLDLNGEGVYRPFRCSEPTCEERFTNVAAFREHVGDEHDGVASEAKVMLEPALEDATIGRMMMGLVFALRSGEQGNPYVAIRKPLDGSRSDEVVRRIRNARAAGLGYWHLKPDDHAWLVGVLDRKLPVVVDGKAVKPAEARELGYEQQTVAMALFGLAEDAVRLHLKPLGERPKVAVEADDPDAEAIGVRREAPVEAPADDHRAAELLTAEV